MDTAVASSLLLQGSKHCRFSRSREHDWTGHRGSFQSSRTLSLSTMISSLRRTGLLAVAVALMAACSSEPATSPTPRIAAPEAPSADLLSSLLLTPLLQRTTPLAAPTTLTQTVGTAARTLST